MTLHAVCQYILFRLHARGRHGTHSPFVYHFVEQVLRNKHGKGAVSDTATLLAQLSAVYGMPIADTLVDPASIMLLPESMPQDWETCIAKYTSVLSKGFVVLPAIHRTAQHTLHWDVAIMQSSVTMSIDLYHTGLLLSRTEFKEKQHFILR